MNKKQIIETVKTIVITALVVGIGAFIAGVTYQKSVSDDVHQQVKELTAAQSTQSKE